MLLVLASCLCVCVWFPFRNENDSRFVSVVSEGNCLSKCSMPEAKVRDLAAMPVFWQIVSRADRRRTNAVLLLLLLLVAAVESERFHGFVE